MGQGAARIYNILTLIFITLTVLVIVLVAARLAAPPPPPPIDVGLVPTLRQLPTLTPTATYTNTLTPTFTLTPTLTLSPTLTDTPDLTGTVSAFTATFTFTPSPTRTPTATLSPTIVPSEPPTLTVTPSPTITNTLLATQAFEVPLGETPPINIDGGIAPQPSEPTLSPFPFAARDQVVYTTNFINTAGCNWQGIGGQVFDVNNQALTNVRVHVYGTGFDTAATSGSNTLIGPSGWEITVSNTLTSNTYIVELQSPQGTIISPPVQVTFTPDCTRNLALVTFVQTRPF